MKLRMLCACLIAMLISSAAAFGELVPTGDGKTSGSVSASASNGRPDDYEEDWGDNGYYTTEAGEFSYYFEAYAHAWAKVVEADGWGYAVAVADAYTSGFSAHVSFSFSSTNEDSDTDNPETEESSASFGAYTGVSASFTVIAGAQIEEGSYSSAGASAYAYALANMW